MVDVNGTTSAGFGRVADAFRDNFVERGELGAACAVMVDGELVVDLWGGHRDKKRTAQWEENTLVTMWSTTKGMAATATAVAHSRGLFELDEPVAAYWPEFAQGGKEAITVRQLLAHQAGLAVIDQKISLEMLGDFEQLGSALAKQPPGWVPGTARGYHAQTLGFYQSQLLSRIDPKGRTIGRFFAEEVADVLGVEFHIGLPKEIGEERLARFVGGNIVAQMLNFREVPWPVLRGLINPRSEIFKAFTNPRAVTKLPDINKRKLLDLELPSVNGTGTARSVASVYGDLASGGKRLGVGASTLAAIEEPGVVGLDRCFGIESAFNFGFMKQFPLLPFGTSPRAFGHTGSGGSFGYANPDKGLGYCYAMNKAGYSLPTDPREIALRTAVETCASG